MIRRLRALLGLPAPTPPPPFRFPEARHGQGALRYHGAAPVLVVGGTPEEVGEQMGVQSVRPAPRLLGYPEDLLSYFYFSRTLARLLLKRATRIGEGLLARFPEGPLREFAGLVASGLDRD